MPTSSPHKFLRWFITFVWLINGLWCKVLGMVPRHKEIVAEILGVQHAGWITIAIGMGEVGVAAWVLSGWKPRLCAAAQVGLVVVMNLLEYVLVPHLLLWGRWNAFFAALFVVVLLAAEFLRKQNQQPAHV